MDETGEGGAMLEAVLPAIFIWPILAGGAGADDATQSVQPFFEARTEHCVVRAATEPKWQVIRVDMNEISAGRDCVLSKQETVQVYSLVLKTHKDPRDRTAYASLMVGSVGRYPWIQKHLMETARADTAWMPDKGRPADGRTNAYVNRVLSRPAVVDVFNRAAAPYGFRLADMDCEKVSISDDGLPYDAFCWLRITPR